MSPPKRLGLFVLCGIALVICLPPLFGANTIGAPPTEHGAMEAFGIGPEMFCDRGVAWMKAIGTVMSEAVSQFGIVALAIIMLWQNLSAKAAIKTVKDDAKAAIDTVKEDVTARLDSQRKAITQVAMAVPAVAQTITDDTKKPDIDRLVQSDEPIPVVVTNTISDPANVKEQKETL